MLCRADGTVLGALPPFTVEEPHLQSVREVVRGARDAFGIDVVVLRLLEGTSYAGGEVTYLAEVDPDPPLLLRTYPRALPEHPLRHGYAQAGGPAADLAWAVTVLRARGTPPTGPAEQHRTWNLSSLWRVPIDGGAAWLKVVPPFFAHEGELIRLLAADSAPVPAVLATDGPRTLLAEVPGVDLWDASPAVLAELVGMLVAIQARWFGRVDEVLALGAPDWRAPPLAASITKLVEHHADRLDRDTSARLEGLVDGLPVRFAALAACGLPDTLVHGDFHPGNARGTPPVLLDWSDSGVGHPLLDMPALLEGAPDPRPSARSGPGAGGPPCPAQSRPGPRT